MRTGLRRSALVAVLAAACGGGETTTGPTPPPGPTVATIEVTPAVDTVRVGLFAQFTAVVKDAQGNALAGKTVTWTTTNGSVATVSSTGLVSGVARGTVTVTAAVDGKSGSASAVVEDETSLLPAAGCRDCLEIVPGGLLLTGAGEEASLAAYLVDGVGVRTKVAATFTSAKPAVVTVSAAGVARAVAFGSAQVTAQANGKTSTPILVVVASPAAGAVLVADTLIDGRPKPSDPRAPYGVGYKYKVRLRGLVPTVGQMLVGSGSLPVLGRVVGVAPVPGGLLEAELEVRPVAESFREFAVNEKMRLVDTGASASPVSRFWPTSRLAQPADDPLEEDQFRLGPFVCESSIGGSVGFPVNVLVETLDLNPQLEMELVANASGGNLLAVTGTLAPHLTVTPTLTAALEAELECRKTVRTLHLPARFAGALSVLITPQVPVGVGFTLAIKSGIPDLSVKATVQGSVFVGVALNCTNFQCASASQTSASLTSTFIPSLPTLGARHEMEVGGFVFAELELSNPIVEGLEQGLGEDFDLTFFDFVTGVKQKLEVATVANQADDPAYASGASLSAFWEASSEAELEVGDLLSVQLLDYSEEGDSVLARTPRGSLDLGPDTVRVAAYGQPGDTLLLRATLWPVTYLGAQSVAGVEFFWKSPTGLVRACFVEPDHPGQVEFECEFTFTEEHLGPQAFYAFVQAKIFGVPFATPFELAEEAKAVVQVIKEPPLTITTSTLPPGSVGVPYAAQLTATGGSGAAHWQVVAGALPAGLVLNAGTGQITGTPMDPCTCEFTIELRRGQQYASRDLSIAVGAGSIAGSFSGTWTYTAGPNTGLVRSTGGQIRVLEMGEYGNHLLTFQNVDGQGTCGLMVSGETISVVAVGENCRWRAGISFYYYATAWSVTRDEVRITFQNLGAALTITADLRLTRLP